MNLIVDVGTNAEIVLGNRDRLLAASSPTGPAFEGAQISCGQRAAPGAIERVRIDPETLEPRIRVIGCDAWSDEPGVRGTRRSPASAARGSSRRSRSSTSPACSRPTGRSTARSPSRSQRIVADGRTFSYVLWTGEPELVITQNDVRQIQLAKAALYAGCALLMERYGIERVDRIRLAGAFGTHIDPVHALVLGLVPDCDPERSPRRATPPARVRGSPFSTGPREPRSRRSCAASRRWRPRSSRASRSSSSTRWRSRTTSTRTRGWRGRFGFPRAELQRRSVPHVVVRGGSRDRDQRTPFGRARGAAGCPAERRRRERAVPHPHPGATRGRLRRGAGAAGGERGHDPRAGRDRLPRRARRDRAVPRRRCRDRRRACALPAWHVPSARAGDGAARVHAGRAEPRAQRRLRRAEHDLRARLRVAVRARPRQRAPLRDDRGLPELREARVRLARGSTTPVERSANRSTSR